MLNRIKKKVFKKYRTIFLENSGRNNGQEITDKNAY